MKEDRSGSSVSVFYLYHIVPYHHHITIQDGFDGPHDKTKVRKYNTSSVSISTPSDYIMNHVLAINLSLHLDNNLGMEVQHLINLNLLSPS